MDVFDAIENSGLGAWVRESGSLWAYPMIVTFHSFGLAIVVGLNAAIDLRVLGFAPILPLAPMEKLFPWMAFGFWMNALSGLLLTIADARAMVTSPLFIIKMSVIGLAVANLFFLKRIVFHTRNPETSGVPAIARLLAATSLVLWTGAITAGRLTAYLGGSAGIKGGP